MTPKSSGPTWRTALTACALMAALTASCAQTPPPALLPPPAAAQSQQALAAKRIGEAIQSVNWSSTNEADARKTMEAAMEPFGMTFSYFNTATSGRLTDLGGWMRTLEVPNHA
jgi:hypothetical protein